MAVKPTRHGMSYHDIAMVLARALEDANFREKLFADPKKTIERTYKDYTAGAATVEFFLSLKDHFGKAVDKLKGQRDAIMGARDM